MEDDKIKKSLTDSFIDADLGYEESGTRPKKKKKKVKKAKGLAEESEIHARLS
jgi:hypothetical protein